MAPTGWGQGTAAPRSHPSWRWVTESARGTDEGPWGAGREHSAAAMGSVFH